MSAPRNDGCNIGLSNVRMNIIPQNPQNRFSLEPEESFRRSGCCRMSKKPQVERRYERVARDLAKRIAQGRYQVGQRLPAERELALAYSVSRPTLREALIALELDGLVEVRMGSGVYVTAEHPRSGKSVKADIGTFDLLEARRAIESEVCALAAIRITDEALVELEGLVEEMHVENGRDVVMREDADRRFHLAIAAASQNSGMQAVVKLLWDACEPSPRNQHLSPQAIAAGVKPRIDEYTEILAALRDRDPEAARLAMRSHLSRMIEAWLNTTEHEELEKARANIEEKRRRYAAAALHAPLAPAKRQRVPPRQI